jgi:hypothetical protein
VSADVPISGEPMTRTRRTWFSVVAALFVAIFGLGLFGLVGLVFGWIDNESGGIHRVHIIGGMGITTGILIAVPFLLLAWRRDDVALLQAIAVVGLAFAVASVFASDWVGLAFLSVVAIPVVALLAISRGWRRFANAGDGFAPAVFVVSLASAVFWVTFALSAAKLQRIGSPHDPHVEMHHWTSMASMALAIVFLGLLASLKTKGWAMVARLVAAGSIVYGVASIVFARFPGTDVPYPGGEGAVWGLAAVAGGIVMGAAAWWDSRGGRSA